MNPVLQVASIDPQSETPVHHGNILCMSIYCGPEQTFEIGSTVGDSVWIDFYTDLEEKRAMFNVMAAYLACDEIQKVWHNYGFDRHIIDNHLEDAYYNGTRAHGLQGRPVLRGFFADTMHMARLWDASRKVQVR